MREDDEASAVEGDWKFAAMVGTISSLTISHYNVHTFQVLDRLCLVLFTIFTALATIIVLMAAPHVIVK